MRKAFNFFRSYYDIAQELSDKDRLAFYDALLKKQFDNIESKLTGMANFAYISQKHSIDSQIKGYFDKTKDESFNPSVPPTQGGNVAPSVQEKEKGQEKEQEKEKVEVQVVKQKLKFLDIVFLLPNEYNNLLNEYSQNEVNWMIEKLNSYKMSTGKKYKSDYHAICQWVKDAFQKAKKDFIKDNNTSEVRMAIAMKAIENINWDDYTKQR